MDGDAGAAWLPGVDLPRVFTIRESSHRVHNPFTEADLATLGRALRLAPGTRIPDLACGTGELLCTWARDHGTTGTGVDISTVFLGTARERAAELGWPTGSASCTATRPAMSPTPPSTSPRASAPPGSAAG